MNALERNIRYYPVHRLFLGLLIIGPVLTPYLRSKGFVYTEIMLLQSISAVSLVVFEMPTGIVADRVSRRLSPRDLSSTSSLHVLRRSPWAK